MQIYKNYCKVNKPSRPKNIIYLFLKQIQSLASYKKSKLFIKISNRIGAIA